MSPHAFNPVLLIVNRELGQYFRTLSGYVFIAVLLAITGLLFNSYAIGTMSKYSADVLFDFFEFASGTTMIAGLVLSMRVIAEEYQTGSFPLLASAPITEAQIVWAKFLSAYSVVIIYITSTIYMPILIFVNGQISLGHIFAGYVGLLALGAASTAIGVFGSAVMRSQLFAFVVSGITLSFMLILWLVARLVDGPLSKGIAYLSLHHKHFYPFKDGTIGISHLFFYISVVIVFLTFARNVLEARRWRS